MKGVYKAAGAAVLLLQLGTCANTRPDYADIFGVKHYEKLGAVQSGRYNNAWHSVDYTNNSPNGIIDFEHDPILIEDIIEEGSYGPFRFSRTRPRFIVIGVDRIHEGKKLTGVKAQPDKNGNPNLLVKYENGTVIFYRPLD